MSLSIQDKDPGQGQNASAGVTRGRGDAAPGDEHAEGALGGLRSYVVGLFLALLLTAASFGVALVGKDFIYPPALPMVLIALAVGQMGVHLVFFLHITTGPDNTNNVLALAFGTLIVGLVLVGTLWIMANLDANHHMAMTTAEQMRMRP